MVQYLCSASSHSLPPTKPFGFSILLLPFTSISVTLYTQFPPFILSIYPNHIRLFFLTKNYINWLIYNLNNCYPYIPNCVLNLTGGSVRAYTAVRFFVGFLELILYVHLSDNIVIMAYATTKSTLDVVSRATYSMWPMSLPVTAPTHTICSWTLGGTMFYCTVLAQNLLWCGWIVGGRGITWLLILALLVCEQCPHLFRGSSNSGSSAPSNFVWATVRHHILKGRGRVQRNEKLD